MLCRLALALLVAHCWAARPRNRLRLQRAQRAREAAARLSDGAENRSDGAAELRIFWDLDNKRPKNLDLAMAHLPSFFPEHRIQSVRLYASWATLRHPDCRPLASSLLQEDLDQFLEDFPENFPHGALYPLSCGTERAVFHGRADALLVAPARPQAADFWLVKDVAELVAPGPKGREPGSICIISDDSDFRQVILDIHQSGWQCCVLCQSGSWTLRKRADLWFDWQHFLATAPPVPPSAPSWRTAAPAALPRADLRVVARAHRDMRWSRDVSRQRHRHLRGPAPPRAEEYRHPK